MSHSVSSRVAHVLSAELALVADDPARATELLTVGRALLRRAELDDALPVRRASTVTDPGVLEVLEVELPGVGDELDGAVVPVDYGTSSEVTVTADALLAAVRYLGAPGRDGVEAVAVEDVTRLSGGFSKEMVRARVAWADGTHDAVVVRKVVAGRRADGLRPEHDVLRFVVDHGVVAPEPWWCDESALGSPAMTTAVLPGATRGDVGGWTTPPSDAAVRAMASTLAGLHNLPIEEMGAAPLPPLVDGDDRHAALTERQDVLAGLWVDDDAWRPAFAPVLAWLESHLPATAGRAVLVHGDFGPHNLLMVDDDVTGVLDWERARVGAPAEDLAYVRPTLDDRQWALLLAAYRESDGPDLVTADLDWYLLWQDLWRATSAYRMRAMFLADPQQVLYAVSGLLLAPRFLARAVRTVAALGATAAGVAAC